MNGPTINVTPLIDVLLVLLIIFMVVSPIRPEKLDARIPQESKGQIVDLNPDTLVVNVEKDGTLSLNSKRTDSITADLRTIFLQRAANLVSERTVFIRAPKSLDYGTFARIVDDVRQGGASPIGLQVDSLDD